MYVIYTRAHCDCFHQSECSTVYFNYVQALAQQAFELFSDDSRKRGFGLKDILLSVYNIKRYSAICI